MLKNNPLKKVENIINELIQLPDKKGLRIHFFQKQSVFVLLPPKTKTWHSLLFFMPMIGCWIWWFYEREGYTILLLIGFSIYWLFLFSKILRADNKIVIGLVNQKIKVENINSIGKLIFDTKIIACSEQNQIVKSKNLFYGRHDKSFRLKLKTKNTTYQLIDVQSHHLSDEILFGLNHLVKSSS